MGACGSNATPATPAAAATGTAAAALTAEEKRKKAVSKTIDEQLREEKKKNAKSYKLLLLGAGDSGKSTFCKQMKVIHMNGFTQDELISYKPIIHVNILEAIKSLIAAAHRFGYELEPSNRPLAAQFHSLNILESEFTGVQAEGIKKLWKDPAIKRTWERADEFQLHEVAAYLFDHLDRISQPNYIPDQNDCLRCRARTTGIIETEFSVEEAIFKMVDVGG